MHVEADLDNAHTIRLLALQQKLKKPITEIVADLLSKALDQNLEHSETEGQKMLGIFADEGLIGCLHNDDEQLSVDYKKHLWGNE
jgi:hypothetical protein